MKEFIDIMTGVFVAGILLTLIAWANWFLLQIVREGKGKSQINSDDADSTVSQTFEVGIICDCCYGCEKCGRNPPELIKKK